MLIIDEINNIYAQFQQDIDSEIEFPELLFFPSRNFAHIAQIERVLPYAKLLLGNAFFNIKIDNRYLVAVLYHEFTHIWDRLIYLSNINDERKHRNLLFPYTEYHASQIEMKKHLDLFHNPQKQVSQSTIVYDEFGTITLKEYLKQQLQDFKLRYEKLVTTPCISNVQEIIYIIIYNIGYYSVCSKYNIDNNLFIDYERLQGVKDELLVLRELLLKDLPSDALCEKTNKLVNTITTKLINEFEI